MFRGEDRRGRNQGTGANAGPGNVDPDHATKLDVRAVNRGLSGAERAVDDNRVDRGESGEGQECS